MKPIQATAEEVIQALQNHREYIMQETLAVDIQEGDPEGYTLVIECKDKAETE